MQRADRRASAGMKLEAALLDRMGDAGVRVVPLPAGARAYACEAAGQPHAPQDPRRRRPHRAHRRRRHRRGVDRQRAGLRPLARHARARAGAGRARPVLGAFAENWLEATGEVLAGPGLSARPRESEDGGPMMVVRSSAGVGDSNVEAMYYLAIAAARETLDLTAAYFAPATGVHRGAPGRVRARRARARAGAWREHRQAAGLDRRARVLRRADRGGRASSTSTSRRCCTRRR